MLDQDRLLALMRQDARHTADQLASLLAVTESDVANSIAEMEKNGTILGYQTVVNREKRDDEKVSAFIEVKLSPERGGGFDRLAMRIARFDQVVSCYLASGGYDLMVVAEGKDLREVARFVSEKLSTLEGILSTSTFFRLKTYKENGFMFEKEATSDRLMVSP